MGKLIKSTRLGEKINGKAYAKMPCFLKKKFFQMRQNLLDNEIRSAPYRGEFGFF